MSARGVAELVVQLGRIAHGYGYTEGLTPAQWSALRYLSRANRFSRTVSAFAEFHATTRGTASQTVKCLVARGYLSRTRSPRDGRSARLQVTDNAGLFSLATPARLSCAPQARCPRAPATVWPPALNDYLVTWCKDAPSGGRSACAHPVRTWK